MLDYQLIVDSLKAAGHTVEHVNKIPENAGSYEFIVDGRVLTLEETRLLLKADAVRDDKA